VKDNFESVKLHPRYTV